MATHAPITGARTCAPTKLVAPRFPIPVGSLAETAQTTRRGVLGIAGLAGVSLAIPAIATPTFATSKFAVSHARHQEIERRFNALPEEVEYGSPDVFEALAERLDDATRELDRATPTTLSELVQLMEHTIGDGAYPGREMCDLLIGHARRLAG